MNRQEAHLRLAITVTSETLTGGIEQSKIPQGCASMKVLVPYEGAEVGGGCDYIEDWGEVPKQIVTKGTYTKMCKSLKDALGVLELSQCGEHDLKLLLALGAKEKQILTLWKKHPRLERESCALTLSQSARLFHDFGMDARVLMESISSSHNWHGYDVLLWLTPYELRDILSYFRDELGVKDMGKALKSIGSLLLYPLQSIKERVDGARELVPTIDGNFVEKYGTLLTQSTSKLQKTAHALELALRCRAYLKSPMLLTVNADSVPDKISNLCAVVDNVRIVDDLVQRLPSVSMVREATVKETCCKLVEMLGENEVINIL